MRTFDFMKYKVTTDNLNWLGISRGMYLSEEQELCKITHLDPPPTYIPTVKYLVSSYPDWFEEVNETQFTKQDMIDFANYYWPLLYSNNNVIPTEEAFNKWIKK